MSNHARDREDTIYRLALEGWPMADIRRLLRYSATAQRLAVLACNRELTGLEEQTDKRMTRNISALATSHGCSARIGGDPRGYCVKLALPSGSHNTWGGKEDGWGIPARG